jgi:hypothetical protein
MSSEMYLTHTGLLEGEIDQERLFVKHNHALAVICYRFVLSIPTINIGSWNMRAREISPLAASDPRA